MTWEWACRRCSARSRTTTTTTTTTTTDVGGTAEQTPGSEGEFDTLLWQEVGDLIGVATLGSCNRGVSARALRYLLGCPRLLVAYDVDAEGERGAERLRQLSRRLRPDPPQAGKHVTAFWQAGGRRRDWVRFELVRR